MATTAPKRPSIEQEALFGDVIARAATYSRERVARTALELLALRPQDRVLELGCGSGRLVAQVAARVQRGAVVGIEPSPLMLRHARFRNRRFVELLKLAAKRVAILSYLQTVPLTYITPITCLLT
jgi:protein-L-isoaspartate O-methyltransferase